MAMEGATLMWFSQLKLKKYVEAGRRSKSDGEWSAYVPRGGGVTLIDE